MQHFLNSAKTFLAHLLSLAVCVCSKWINMHVFQTQQVWGLGGKQGIPPSATSEFWYKQQHKGHDKKTFHLSNFDHG